MSQSISVSRIKLLPHCSIFARRSGRGTAEGVSRICGTSSAGNRRANGVGAESRRSAMRVESSTGGQARMMSTNGGALWAEMLWVSMGVVDVFQSWT
jgi:hypothetical protein